jgi:hypothetical protein
MCLVILNAVTFALATALRLEIEALVALGAIVGSPLSPSTTNYSFAVSVEKRSLRSSTGSHRRASGELQS